MGLTFLKISTMDENLLQALWACSASCEYCADKSAEKNESTELIRLLRDCSDLCMIGARFYTRGSVFAGTLLEQCMRACSMSLEMQKEMEGSWHDECRQTCEKCLTACQKYLQENK